ncbi:MAG: UPF0149 family protein [Sphingomonas sp.]|nr:UPF0149 family protein [Sphingomonas sp.]
MLLSELDGFVTGVIVSPEPIPPSDWLPRIWNGGEPPFETDGEAERFVALVMRHHDDTVASLGRPGEYVPLLDTDPRDGESLWELWIEGFALALKLAPKGWNRLRASEDAVAKAALDGIVTLVAVANRTMSLDETGLIAAHDDVGVFLANWVQLLHEWRLENDRRPSEGKIGRNDRCPCGSGKKYKKCCGLN